MKPLVIDNFQKGVAGSPALGFSRMNGIDIRTSTGYAKCSRKTTKVSGSTVTDFVKFFARNPDNSGEIWALGDTQKLYRSTDSGQTWTHFSSYSQTGTATGLIIVKDALFVAGLTTIDVLWPLSGGASVYSNWQFVTSSSHHPMLWGQDDKLYIGNDSTIASVSFTGTFNPSNGSTYTWNASALNIPTKYTITCLAELERYLCIGTFVGVNVYDNPIADIILWDRVSTSFESPIQIAEQGVWQMKSMNNRLYAVAGLRGNLYVTDISSYSKVSEIPDYLSNFSAGYYYSPYSGGIDTYDGRLFIGVSSILSGGTSQITGVWSYGNGYSMDFIMSTGNYGNSVTNIALIGGVMSLGGNAFLMGWRDGSTYGIDMVTPSNNHYSDYTSYLESQLIPVGSTLEKTTYSTVEVQLARTIRANETIRVSWRDGLNGTYQTIGTTDSNYVGFIGFDFPAVLNDAQSLQIKIEMAGTTTSPEISRIILK